MNAYDRILETFEKLDTPRIKEIGKLESKDFSRNKKMPFNDITRYILSQKGKTIAMEINNYFKEVNKRENCATKQAFCKQRCV
jgi:CHASE3 domain sensor protein